MTQTPHREFRVYNEGACPPDKKAGVYPDWPTQIFHASPLDKDSVESDGFKPWALPRNIGMIEATRGAPHAR